MTANIGGGCLFLCTLFASSSCALIGNSGEWAVEETEIALYHSSTADPESGTFFHVEYCAARLARKGEELYIVYRPIDFQDRNPGFSQGDSVTVTGLDDAEDFGALDGRDYWITDVQITQQ